MLVLTEGESVERSGVAADDERLCSTSDREGSESASSSQESATTGAFFFLDRIFFLLLFNLLLHPESVGTEDSEQDSNTMGHIKDFAVEKASESMSGRRS